MRLTRNALIVIAAATLVGAGPAQDRTAPPAAAAASDQAADTDFLFRLGMLEGHLMVGHDLLTAGQASLALPHYGHPVRELYDDISDYLESHAFPAFDTQLVRLESAAASAPAAAATESQYQAVIETVHKARDLTPPTLRGSVPAMIKVCADTIDAAAGEYSGALQGGKVTSLIEYHDSRGYVSWVTQFLNGFSAGHPDAQSQGLIGRIKTVAAKAEWIVDPLLPAAEPRASVGEYRTVAAEAATVAHQ